jgi:hypothetical protein
MRRSDMKLHLQGLKNQFPIWRRREKEKWKFSRFNRDCVNAIFTISTMKNIKYVCSSWSLFLMNSNRKINYIIVLWFALLLREDIVGFYLNKKKPSHEYSEFLCPVSEQNIYKKKSLQFSDNIQLLGWLIDGCSRNIQPFCTIYTNTFDIAYRHSKNYICIECEKLRRREEVEKKIYKLNDCARRRRFFFGFFLFFFIMKWILYYMYTKTEWRNFLFLLKIFKSKDLCFFTYIRRHHFQKIKFCFLRHLYAHTHASSSSSSSSSCWVNFFFWKNQERRVKPDK